ncbi:ATP-binding protein [bacterium]|nr:ATP-binding protein [bacterium]
MNNPANMLDENLRPKDGNDRIPPPYRRLWRFSVLFTLVTAIVPLAVMTAIKYYQDQEAIRTESRFTVSRIVSNTKRTLEYIIEERHSVLALMVGSRSYTELSSDESLEAILRNLNASFGGFVDLGIIDADGNQIYYVGPYDLENKNYKDQAWFHEVVLRGAYVSDVFMGHRNLPHFVIAFRHEKGNDGYFILRATIDMELLNKQIYTLHLDRYTDAFIINQNRVLQTASAFHGAVLDTVDVTLPTHSRDVEVIDQYEMDNLWVTRGYVFVEKTPFVFMVIRKQPLHFGSWLVQRSDLIWFLFVSVSLILAAVLYSHHRMIRYLRQADMRRAKLLHNVEYTNKMATIGRMAAGVAHEINNPLAIINEKAGLLKDVAGHAADYPDKEKTVGIADVILQSVERCSRVTHRLLGFARRMDVRKEPIELEQLVREVVGFQRSEASHRSIEVEFHIQRTPPPVISDRGQLQQVFLNIINNAFAAVADNGHIDIAISQPTPADVAVSVSDNGKGISHHDLEHIFEPFFSTKGEFGTGLGLSITRDIVRRLGGTIDVESELGKGTRFIVTLPVKEQE